MTNKIMLSDISAGTVICFCLLVLFGMCETSLAATYYVSPSGTADWNECVSESTPCAVSTAMSRAVAGDTVIFKAGTYYITAGGRWYQPDLQPANSGTSGSPITFKSAAKGAVILRAADPSIHSSPFIGAYNREYIVWDGFILDSSDISPNYAGGRVIFHTTNYCAITNSEVIGHTWNTEDNYSAIGATHSEYLTVSNNRLHGFKNGFVASGMIFFNVYHAIIENNEIYDNECGFFDKEEGTHNSYRYNYVHDNSNLGVWIHTQGGKNIDDIRIYQNIFANNGGVNMSVDSGMTITNIRWRNNTFYNSGGPRFAGNGVGNGVSENNLLVNGDGATLWGLTDSGSGNTPEYVDYNLYYGPGGIYLVLNYGEGSIYYTNLSDWQALGYDGHSSLDEPIFVNSSGNMSLISDYALASNSPGYNAGSDGNSLGANINFVGPEGYCSSHGVKIQVGPDYFTSISSAYDISETGDTILIQAMAFPEELILNKNISLKGGYDCAFTTNAGYSTIAGKATIGGAGTVNMADMIIR